MKILGVALVGILVGLATGAPDLPAEHLPWWGPAAISGLTAAVGYYLGHLNGLYAVPPGFVQVPKHDGDRHDA